MRLILSRGDDIKQVVHGIAKVYVRNASFGIHGLSAVSAPSSIGMGGFVLNAMVGFCFNYYPARYFSINLGIKHFSKQVFC